MPGQDAGRQGAERGTEEAPSSLTSGADLLVGA